MVRITQQNDWVIYIITGCIFLYIFMLVSLQRDSSFREFLMQKFPDSTNNFLSWLIIGLVFTLVFSTFVSQSVPLVPRQITDVQLFGYQLNKFGFSFLAVAAFYLLKNALTYLFFAGTGALKKWEKFYFSASKLYFVFSVVLMALCIFKYFYNFSATEMFGYYLAGISAVFLFKLIFYILHPADILPPKWYYKILYICTLQIVPVLVLWRLLFF
ncbi:DUF4271 domain-containing protein [Kaistella palustris]|uniref:DUF4271 domain-containing protein n=1 Tax=Kaistella palustris TaxID=493376 RepID=UPI001F1949FF|nr:DUF4271 domain-containing protein [Kaistella palustris]